MFQTQSQGLSLCVLILIAALIPIGIGHTSFQRKCNSAKCLAFYKICDEITNCTKKAVEPCLQETYRLDVSQCGCNKHVPGTSVWNGHKETTDKWRETKYLPALQSTSSGCKVPLIPNSLQIYESEHAKVLIPGENVLNGTRTMYICESGYSLEGQQYSQCINSTWFVNGHTECIKYCSSKDLESITFTVECTKDGSSVSCNHRIKPGTRARITCHVGYRKLYQNPKDTYECQKDGHWDSAIFSCEPICGKETITIEDSTLSSESTQITYIPWHVGIYRRFRGLYENHCGGSIISEKVIISAAHCFWDSANQKTFDKSYYAIGAGKIYRNYYANEPFAQYKKIHEIAVPSVFKGKLGNYRGDIAILVLVDFLKFSLFIAPICISWLSDRARSFPSGKNGQTAGWGKNENGTFSTSLRVISLQSASYKYCKETGGSKFASHITSDKFCVLKKFDPIVCEGDSGGGFTIKMGLNNTYVYHLSGVLSIGVPGKKNCEVFEFVSYTNIQYYKYLIENRVNASRLR